MRDVVSPKKESAIPESLGDDDVGLDNVMAFRASQHRVNLRATVGMAGHRGAIAHDVLRTPFEEPQNDGS